MELEFTVVGSNPSNEGKTHVWKLQTNTTVSAFGLKKNVVRTYYIGGMPAEAEKGKVIKEKLDKFEIVERAFVNPETGELVQLKWLHAKPY